MMKDWICSQCGEWRSDHPSSILPRTESPSELEGYLGNVIDVWHKAHPNLTVNQILVAIEAVRHKLTEGLIEHSR
jgi:hypothetical protein